MVVGFTPELVCGPHPPLMSRFSWFLDFFRSQFTFCGRQFCDKRLRGGLHTCDSDLNDLSPGLQEGAVQQQCGGVAVEES